MASPSSPQHEPTMEEILASIRKIISEDSNESPPVQQPATHAAAQDADVLELTQEVQEVVAPAPVVQPAPVAQVAPAPVVAPARQADDVVFQSIEEAPVSVVAQTPPAGFVSDKARRAMDDALSALNAPDEPAPVRPAAAPRAAAPLPIDGNAIAAVYERAIRETFDPVLRSWLNEQADAVVERLKPAIREWMDENLPAMMKSVVEAEVAKAVAARGKR